MNIKMASCVNAKSSDHGNHNYQNSVLPNDESPSKSSGDKDEEREYDEDEDVDFNPFLKETSSRAASSSLGSEVEALDDEVVNSRLNTSISLLKTSVEVRNRDGGEDSENEEEESLTQSNVSSEGPCGDPQNTVSKTCKRKKIESLSQAEVDNSSEETSTKCTILVNHNEQGGLGNTIQTPKMLEKLHEDAICMRTRARYSLASFTLDELEAFLQETDDEDEVQNVNDEEEYRKFLAAVLHCGENEGRLIQEHENGDDDDEDNDVDFQIEIEEALESDDEEDATEKARIGGNNNVIRRPETRRNRQQKGSVQHKKNFPLQAKRPVYPIVPLLPNGIIIPLDRRNLIAEPGVMMSDGLISGFTPFQLGQLHCLIHEHVQLLIQVYSLCVLDPARQHIATQVHGLISEMIHKLEELIAQKREPHPFINAPLSLAARYMDDVSAAVRDYRRRQLESSCDTSCDRRPLFPCPQHAPSPEANSGLKGNCLLGSNAGPSSSSQQHPKKTLAASLVETAKKQSVALVPKEIAKLAERFFPLFKPFLFPHKPPPASAAKRVLFTDAEDELLALGIMEYNSDWKAIQQRFLPCKSKNQIFVRQKNRCSSKAPENPIKAVRRMKNSPLTAEEIACIQEGLKRFKFDWMSVWNFIVPYRDPSLLPRQWRIALGVQKSYKLDAAKKEKRRLYELRRRCKASSANRQLASDKLDHHAEANGNETCVGDVSVDNPVEAYVHEGFLADWRPGVSNLLSSEHPYSYGKTENVPTREETGIRERSENSQNRNSQSARDNMHRFQHMPMYSQQPLYHPRNAIHSGPVPMPLNYQVSNTASTASRPIVLRPYRARRSYNPRVVRLAPELPPVNLPPSVRIIPQSTFTCNLPERSTNASTVKGAVSDKHGRPKDTIANLREDEREVAKETCVVEERNADPELRMHPLLFQTPENGHLAYLSSSNAAGGSSSFSFFSENQPQLLSLFNSPRQINHAVDQFQKTAKSNGKSTSSGNNDFHPLLKRVDDPSSNLVTAHLNLAPSIGLEGGSCQLRNPLGAIKNSTVSTSLVAVRCEPSSSPGRPKETDLDVNRSSVKEKGFSKDMVANLDSQNTHPTENNLDVSGLAATSNDIRRFNMDEIGDQSNVGIVMEQEELSDSDEEMEEEDVEFECEEMADSEGEEGSGCEEIAEMQDKSVPSPVMENTGTDADSSDEQGLEGRVSSQGNISIPIKQELGKDSMSSPWLSLDSCSRPPSRKASRLRDKTTTKQHNPKTATLLSRSGRSCKKMTPTKKKIPEQKEVVGIAQLLSLGPLAVPTMKKPRKRVCRANININVGKSQENFRSDDKDKS